MLVFSSYRTFAALAVVWAILGNPSRAHAHEKTRPPHVETDLQRELARLPKPQGGGYCRLDLRLVDAETQQPISGLVRARAAKDGQVVRVGGLLNRSWMIMKDSGRKMREQWYCLVEPTTVVLPRTRLTLEAMLSLETEIAQREIDLTGKESFALTLAVPRFARTKEDGWYSANTHLHLHGLTRGEADEYLRRVSRVDGIDLIFVSHLRRQNPLDAEASYITNQYTRDDLAKLSGYGVLFGHGEEHRHNFLEGYGFGHVMLLDIPELIRPVSIGRGLMRAGPDYPPLRHGIRKARGDGGTVIWCHDDDGHEDIPNWLAGHIHAQNIFDSGKDTYEKTFYRYLNVGLNVPFSTGTDWFIFDFGRVYARVTRPLTVRSWLTALQAGRSYITNGPLLELTAGDHQIGDTFRVSEPTTITVTARAQGRVDFGTAELVHNGQVIVRQSARKYRGHLQAQFTHRLRVDQPGWIALRIPQGQDQIRSELGLPLFAHTSPIYIEYDGETVFQTEAAHDLIRDMETSVEAIESEGLFENKAQRKEIMNIYQEALESLRQRQAPAEK